MTVTFFKNVTAVVKATVEDGNVYKEDNEIKRAAQLSGNEQAMNR